jgi:hypothetical protein
MEHGANAAAWRRWELTPGAPARLEVTIDPAAHGPNATGPISRGVVLTTAEGQELQFTLAAVVDR